MSRCVRVIRFYVFDFPKSVVIVRSSHFRKPHRFVLFIFDDFDNVPPRTSSESHRNTTVAVLAAYCSKTISQSIAFAIRTRKQPVNVHVVCVLGDTRRRRRRTGATCFITSVVHRHLLYDIAGADVVRVQ